MDPKPVKDILVVGSHVYGLSISCTVLPKIGETVLGEAFAPYLPDDGGKGSNQAMAAARLGAGVSFSGVAGTDEAGGHGLKTLENAGVDLSRLRRASSRPTGVSVAVLDNSGSSMIVTDPGANSLLDETDIERVSDVFADHKVFLTQFESPVSMVLAAARKAQSSGMRAIVTPGPSQRLRSDALTGIDILAPNETEAAALLGLSECSGDGRDMVREIACRWNVRNVILTQGARGCTILWEGAALEIPAFPVKALNTIGAGDCFVAAFGTGLAWGFDAEQCARFGAAAAALSVQSASAPWSSYPDLETVAAFLAQNEETALLAALEPHTSDPN